MNFHEMTMGFGVFIKVPSSYGSQVTAELIPLKKTTEGAGNYIVKNLVGPPELSENDGKRVLLNLDIRMPDKNPMTFAVEEGDNGNALKLYIFDSKCHILGKLPSLFYGRMDSHMNNLTWEPHDNAVSPKGLSTGKSEKIIVSAFTPTGIDGLYMCYIYSWPVDDQIICFNG
jgi:hypothetical protein